MHEDILLHLDFIHLAQFLTRLPDNICQQDLFAHIAQVRVTSASDGRTFAEMLAANKESAHKAMSVSNSCMSMLSGTCDVTVTQGASCASLSSEVGPEVKPDVKQDTVSVAS